MATITSITDNFFATPQEGFSTTLSSSISSGATTVGLQSVAGYTDGEPVVLVIDPDVPAKKQVFHGVVDTSGSQITDVEWTEGTNQAHTSGATIVDYVTATHFALAVKGFGKEHGQDGTHTDITADSVTSGSFTVTGQTTGMLGVKNIYTASTTWTKPANLKFVTVEVIGGGGGGGGSQNTGSAVAAAAGGGAGGYSFKKIAAASLASTETVTIGAAGAAATAGANAGGGGGTTSFGSHLSATGGSGGGGGTAANNDATASQGGDGGLGSSGDINEAGSYGLHGFRFGTTLTGISGGGGASRAGGGAKGNFGTNNGVAAVSHGAGGGGALNRSSESSRPGGAGAAGVVVVTEFF